MRYYLFECIEEKELFYIYDTKTKMEFSPLFEELEFSSSLSIKKEEYESLRHWIESFADREILMKHLYRIKEYEFNYLKKPKTREELINSLKEIIPEAFI